MGGRPSRSGAAGLADREGRGRRRRGGCAAHGGDAEPGQRVLAGGVRRLDGVAGPADRPRRRTVQRRAEAGRTRDRRPLHRWSPDPADHARRRDGRGGRLARDRHHRRPAGRTGRAGHGGGARRNPDDHRAVRARQRGTDRARRAAVREPARRLGGLPARQGACLHRADDVLLLRPAAAARDGAGARGPAGRARAQRTHGPGRRVRGEHDGDHRRARHHHRHGRAGPRPGPGDRRAARPVALRDRRDRHQGRPGRRPAGRGIRFTRPALGDRVQAAGRGEDHPAAGGGVERGPNRHHRPARRPGTRRDRRGHHHVRHPAQPGRHHPPRPPPGRPRHGPPGRRCHPSHRSSRRPSAHRRGTAHRVPRGVPAVRLRHRHHRTALAL